MVVDKQKNIIFAAKISGYVISLDKFLTTNDYGIRKAVVFNNEMDIVEKNGIVYLPVYYCMFYEFDKADENECIIPEIKFDDNIL